MGRRGTQTCRGRQVWGKGCVGAGYEGTSGRGVQVAGDKLGG